MRKVIALVLYFFLVLWITLASLYALSINQWLFDREFYNAILTNPTLYDDDVALPIVVTGMASEVSGNPQFVETYPNTVDAITTAIQAVLPEGYIEEEVKGAADTILTYVEGDSQGLDLEFDLGPIKATLSEEANQTTFAATLTEYLPLCRGRQRPTDSGNILPDCRLSDQSPEALQTEIIDLIPGYLNKMPESFEVHTGASFADIGTAVKVGTTLGVVVALLLLIIDARLAGRRWRGWLVWSGLLLLIPALAVLVTGFGVQLGMTDSLVRDGTADMEISGLVISQEFRDALQQAVISAATHIAEGFLVVGLLAVLAALALLGMGAAMPNREVLQE